MTAPDPREVLRDAGHVPTGDGDLCLHRWRNRTTRAVHCAFLRGYRAALAAAPSPALDVDGVVAEFVGVAALLEDASKRLNRTTNTLARLTDTDR